jgi:hypothetical protein
VHPGGRELQQCDLGRPWRAAWFVEQDEYGTAALASIGDVADCVARADAQVRAVLGEVMAQRRSTAVAAGYVAALSPGTRANCWSLAESAGHEGWGRMQALLGSYRWDWAELWSKLPALAAAGISHRGQHGPRQPGHPRSVRGRRCPDKGPTSLCGEASGTASAGYRGRSLALWPLDSLAPEGFDDRALDA